MLSTIVIAEDLIVLREALSIALEQLGCVVQQAADGQEALDLVGVAKPDLLILDLAMPRMDGLACLRELRETYSEHELPVIVLTAHSERQIVMDVVQLGVSDYVLKSPFSMGSFLEKVDRALRRSNGHGLAGPYPAEPATSRPADRPAGASLKRQVPKASREPVDPARVERYLAGLKELRGFSPAVTNLLRAIEDPLCTLDQIVESAGLDQALAMRLLWLANSAAFSRGAPITSLRKAVVRIGTEQIREAALTLGVLERFGEGTEAFHYGRFWEHSVAVASLAAEIVRTSPVAAGMEADAAFTWGLLHDVGRLVLIEALDGVYPEVLGMAREHSIPLIAAEARQVGTDHAKVAQNLLAGWKFGARFTRPIGFHHLRPEALPELPQQDRLPVMVLSLANRLSHALLLGESGDDELEEVLSLSSLLGLSEEQLDQIVRIVLENWRDTKSVVRLRSQKDWPDAVERARGRLPKPARPVCVSEGPLSSVLRRFLHRVQGPLGPDDAGQWVAVLRSPGDLDGILDAIDRLEASRVRGLPVILVCSFRNPPQFEVSGRRASVITPPIRVDALLEAIAEMSPPEATNSGGGAVSPGISDPPSGSGLLYSGSPVRVHGREFRYGPGIDRFG